MHLIRSKHKEQKISSLDGLYVSVQDMNTIDISQFQA